MVFSSEGGRVGKVIAVAVLLGGLNSGCDRQEPAPQREVPTGRHAAEPPSPWQRQGDAVVVALPADEEDAEMLAAIAEARSTADEARQRWNAAPPRERQNWAIKWAAPTRDGRVEHVWVRPELWSPFRIEGRLLSSPVAELECGMATGDRVSLPIEALSDWVYSPDGEDHGLREGGFTIRLLEQRFGTAE